MRLYKYINEEISEKDLDELVSYMEKKCKRFLDTLKNLQGSRLIYSGRKDNDGYIIKKVRKERKPRDTPEPLHDLLNQYFEEHIGISLRSKSVFVSPNEALAKAYGNPYAIFPIGKYQLWNSPKAEDLYNVLGNIFSRITSNKIGEMFRIENFLNRYSIENGIGKEVWDEFKEEIERIVKSYSRGFPTKGGETGEWMLYCDSYIGIKLGDNILKPILGKLGLEDSVVM